MKRTLIALVTLCSSLNYQSVYAANLFFNVTTSGIPINASITVCLNAKGPLSCQNYNVSGANLNILSNIPNHTYPNAGIKINSPNYSLTNTNCTPLSNGFCMFSVSDKTPAAVNINPPSADYVIIGAGTAGAVLANKLSNNNQNSVIAIHNGPNLDSDPLINLSENAILTVLSGLIGPPLYAFSYTIPQIFINNNVLRWVYALPLGGASSINAGAWCRATNQVNSQWETLAGSNWSVDQIQQTYVELENYNGTTTNPSARGFQGPLPIRQVPLSMVSTVAKTFTQAIVSATGEPPVLDYNDPNTPIGVSSQPQYTQTGLNGALRASSSITFLNSNVMDANGNGVNGRPLNVIFNATGNNIIWNGTQASGVTYYQNGILQSVLANKGVIVSAGIKSSSFLMRSGVGPAALLQSLNIPVVYNNANVGAGLADQPHVILIYTTNPADTPSSATLQIFGSILSALANTTLGQTLITLIGSNVDAQNGLFSQFAWLPDPTGDPTVRAFRFATINPIPGIAVVFFDLVQPASRGSIQINSTNPFTEPTVDLGEFNNADDLNLYLRGFQVYIKNINTQLSANYPDYKMVYPNPGILDDTNALTDFIKNEVGSDMHFQSHCRMAPLNQGGVVDGTGHVYGVQNLIVADDSIVPVDMDGSPMATAYLIAANIANIILGNEKKMH